MALKLIRRGARLHPAKVEPGTGWVNAARPGSTFPYFIGTGELVVTVTATNCDGVRIYDWDTNPNLFVESSTSGTMHSAVACVSGTKFGPVVRVLNPTENTEVTILSEPLPPPLLNSRVATALGRWLPWR